MKALVIGGTGPTGPHIINGLIARGYHVTMLNRGSRDSDAIPKPVSRVIGDPHFPDTLEDALKGRTFDLVVATYGRIRYVAEVVATKTARLVTVGGPPCYKGYTDPGSVFPPGMPIPTHESAAKVESSEESRFGDLVRATEEALMEQHASGAMQVSHFRYPTVYGPWQVRPTTLWWVMQRCLDKRASAALPEGGLTLYTRGFSENMAHAVLLAVDQPEASGGEIYNCGDELQFSLAQWVALIADAMNHPLEIVSVPDAFASTSRDIMQFKGSSHHQYFGLQKLREQLGYRDRVGAVEAVHKTVQWFGENPPEDEAFVAALRAHYAIEDQLVQIQREAGVAMAALSHREQAFYHAYAHPRQRGLARDHRDR